MSHDQNFKNLILDYPHQALAFFAPDEAADGLPGAKPCCSSSRSRATRNASLSIAWRITLSISATC